MNLASKLQQRASDGNPVRVGLIGAGKFGTMFLAQARHTPGLHVAGVCDLNIDRAQDQLAMACWPPERVTRKGGLDAAIRSGQLYLMDDADALVTHPKIDVIVEATGNPHVGIRLASLAIENGKHVVMVNVEADALAGPLLARNAKRAGVVYSLAWGDQPALICDHVDWARTCGFTVVAAGKGTRYHPTYHQLTPDTVWPVLQLYTGIKEEHKNTINMKMFNSFLDGTKSAIEMTAVCNATGLQSQEDGLSFPPASRFEIAEVCKPKKDGGVLTASGVTEIISSVDLQERPIRHDLAPGTFVVFEAAADNDYTRRCFTEYKLMPDKSGNYAAMYRPTHLIGLELGISIASVALRNEATGAPVCFNADVVATAKRDLAPGEKLDGEGGYCVWGKQTPARRSLKEGYLPLGLAQDVAVNKAIKAGQPLRWADVDIDEAERTVVFRREMESIFAT